MMIKLKALSALVILLSLLTIISLGIARTANPPARRIAQDDFGHFSNVGNLGLTITNFGILGEGFNNPDQPACQYKLRSNILQEQVEHFSYAGIWIGGIKDGETHVSTGILDGSFGYDQDGWEFTTSFADQVKWNPIFHHVNKIDKRFDFSRVDTDGIVSFGGALNAPIEDGFINFGSTYWDTIITRSSIRDASLNNPYAEYAQFFNPNAISHQDLLTAWTDTNTFVPGTDPPIELRNHRPLGIHVNLEAYSWYEPFADAFVILNYTVTNIPDDYFIATDSGTHQYDNGTEIEYVAGDTVWIGSVIEDPYFGIWLDSSVGNMHYTPTSSINPNGGPGGRWVWEDNLNGYDDARHMAYSYDYDGDAGWAQSYLGVKILGTDSLNIADHDTLQSYYSQWVWNGAEYSQDFPIPDNEVERYNAMTYNSPEPPTEESYLASWMVLLTTGPFHDVLPGERFNVAMAIVCGRWNGAGPNSYERRENLNRNSEWAQIAYDGEDRNRNGVLDPGEDLDGDGILDRYILPSSPPSPQLAAIPENHRVKLYWTDEPEDAIDPITSQKDFEGYRIYGSPKTEGITSEWTLLADFDIRDPSEIEDDSTAVTDTLITGYNTGLDLVRLDSPITIEGVTYQYEWVNEGVKNGWPRELYYAVTAYDRGDPANNLPSLESPRDANRVYAFPGTPPAEAGDDRVGVYPNPYVGRASWDGNTGRDRLIWFRNLPAQCEITIFTLAGEQVDKFKHDAGTYDGSDVERINRGASPGENRSFSGGEHAWDLLTEDDQEIASGLYIFTVEDTNTGDVKSGKFVVVK